MASDLTLRPVGTCQDVHGEPIEIGVILGEDIGDDGETVGVYIEAEAGSITLDKAGREDFQRLFMEAERQAEAHDA